MPVQLRIHGVFPCGFPHSDIRGSWDICSSPRLFAAYHVFLRLSVPRHPPCALFCLTVCSLRCVSSTCLYLTGKFLHPNSLSCSLHSVAGASLDLFVVSLLRLPHLHGSSASVSVSRHLFFLMAASDVLSFLIFDSRYSVFKVQCLIKILTALPVIKN